MACVELDRFHRNEKGEIEPMFKVLFRIEIPRTDFTYVNAVNKIVELNEIYDFDHIAIDRGYGSLQIDYKNDIMVINYIYNNSTIFLERKREKSISCRL